MSENLPSGKTLPISVCILAKDEEKSLPSCLESVRGFAEIIVFDTGSMDATVSTAKKLGARVVEGSWDGFGETRKKLFSEAKQPWILWLDADEVLPPDLREEIGNCATSDTKASGFEINRITYVGRKRLRYGDWSPDWRLRFFRKTAWQLEARDVHEFVTVEGSTSRFLTPMPHYGYENWKDRSVRVQRYARLWAAERFREGKRATVFDQLRASLAVFCRGYFFKLGFLNGWSGLRGAISMASEPFYGYRNLRKSWDRFGGGG